MKIRFTQNYTVKDGSGTEYAVGHVLECTGPSANHFMNRGVAVAHVEEVGAADAAPRKSAQKSGKGRKRGFLAGSLGAEPVGAADSDGTAVPGSADDDSGQQQLSDSPVG